MSNRFFAFGCSYTDYNWATWADGMCYDLDLQGWETYNYGNSGMGNEHILNSLVAADLKHKFTDDDVICVLWSSWMREDRLFETGLGPQFCKVGSIVNTDVQPYKSFADQFFVFENYIMKSITAIVAANRAFNISYQAHMGHNEEYSPNEDPDPADEMLYSFQTFDPKNKFYDRGDTEYTAARKMYRDLTPNINAVDGHPNPMVHLQFLKYKVYPGLGWEISTDLRQWMKQQNNLLRSYDKKIPSLNEKQHHTYRGEIEPIKRQSLPNMKDWRDLWSVDRGATNFNAGSAEKGVLEMLERAKPKLY